VGSAHISNTPKRNQIYTSLGSFAKITMLESNEFRGSFKIELSMDIPAEATINGEDRSREMKSLPITTYLTLDKDSKYVKVKTRVKNEMRDHKLVVNYPTFIQGADYASSESAWDVANRTIKWRDHGDNFEDFFPFQPMHNFVDVSDGMNGLAFLNKGLREYEVADDEKRTLKITLIRTQRAYMTANSNMTYEELDKYTGQHSFGTLEYEYALFPHKFDWKKGNVLPEAYGFKVPLKAIQGVPTDGYLPANGEFFTFNTDNQMMISALKQAEDKNGFILRVWNTSNEDLKVESTTILPIAKIYETKLNETTLNEIKINQGHFKFDLPKHKIMTLRLIPGDYVE